MRSLASSSPCNRPARPCLRLVLFAFFVAALFLVPAAQASAAEFLLQVEVTGSGSGNVGCKANGGPIEGCEAEFPEGTQVTVIAEPEAGSEFFEWGGECDSTTGNECEVEMNAEKTIEAIFELEGFELTVETEGEGEGVVECEVDFGPTEPCPASETYPYGSEVTLYAEPEEGSEFIEWGGDCTGAEPVCELTVEEPLSVTATFEPGPLFALNVEEPGTGQGKVQCEANGGPAEACAPEYPQGTKVKLTAEASPGSEFITWEGECDVLVGNECEVEINEEKTVEVTFTAKPLVSLAVNLAGEGEGKVECEVNGGPLEECEVEYSEGTEVALVAVAETGSEFAGFSAGSGSASACSTSPCAFTIEANSEVTATFDLEPTPKFTLKVKKTGTGTGKVESTSPVSPKIVCGTECEKEFEEGTKVTLAQSADPGSEFVKWTGACTGTGACEVTMSAAKEVTAEFNLVAKPKFTLKVKKTGTGTGKVESTSPVSPKIVCGTECEKEFEEGTEVTLIAVASAGSKFISWAGCASEPEPGKCKVTMSAAKEVTATFDLEPPSEFALTVSLAGTGSGTVTSSPAGINCGVDCSEAFAAGTEVTLTASPASGSTFGGWSGACTGTGTCKVTMSQTRSATATFTAESKPPAAGTASVAHTAKVKGGKAQLKLTCKGEGPCKGSLKLTAKIKSGGKTKTLTIGKASFSLAAGASKTLKVKLSGPAKQALAKGPLKAKVSGSGVAASTVKLKLAK
jgi:hypothetical protein